MKLPAHSRNPITGPMGAKQVIWQPLHLAWTGLCPRNSSHGEAGASGKQGRPLASWHRSESHFSRAVPGVTP